MPAVLSNSQSIKKIKIVWFKIGIKLHKKNFTSFCIEIKKCHKAHL